VKRTLCFSTAASWLILFLLLGSAFTAQAQSADPVVRAVLFYSPTCPHCAMVIQDDLPPLFEKYGTQLEIIAVDLSQMERSTLYQAAITRFQNANIYVRNLRS
jgi:thiol-disulfide isomerase/thioredoxin